MYQIANMTQAPIDFCLTVSVKEAMAPGEPDRVYKRGGDIYDGKPSDRTAWSVKWSDKPSAPSSVEVTDAQYAELGKQPVFAALVGTGDLRVTKQGA